jgi:peptidyl-prolyl cis-trans isomerase C
MLPVGIGLILITAVVNGTAEAQATAAGRSPETTVARVGDFVITARDLDEVIKAYPAEAMTTPESKRELVESLITTQLFARAARQAGLDAAEDVPAARRQARELTLAYAYYQRHVQPKLSETAARQYFTGHRKEFNDFSYSRIRIHRILRDRALTETNETLRRRYDVRQWDDRLNGLDAITPADAGLILAQIGPSRITAGDLKRSVKKYPPERVADYQAKKYLLDVLVLERMYAHAAEQEGLLKDPEVQQALARAEDQRLAARYREGVENKVTLEDARRYFQDHPDEFERPEQVRVQQIVTDTLEAARAARARLERGQSFGEVARQVFRDQASAAQSGEVGWVRRGRLYPAIDKVAFELKPEQVSEPVRTPGGYHIIRVAERLAGTPRPFEQVASNLLARLKGQAVQAERRRLMTTYQVTIQPTP